MANVYTFNTSGVSLMFSINNGDFIKLPNTSGSFQWIPLPPANYPVFYNQLNPPKGGFGLGNNILTMYPASSGSQYAGTVNVDIPEDVTALSIQIYLYWKDVSHLGAVVCNAGQYIKAISLP